MTDLPAKREEATAKFATCVSKLRQTYTGDVVYTKLVIYRHHSLIIPIYLITFQVDTIISIYECLIREE